MKKFLAVCLVLWATVAGAQTASICDQTNEGAGDVSSTDEIMLEDCGVGNSRLSLGDLTTYLDTNLTNFFTPTDIDTDYGNETVTSDWVMQGAGATGGNAAYDFQIGSTTYGGLLLGNTGIFSSSFSASNLDLDKAMLFRQVGNIGVGNDPGIEFAWMEQGNTVRMAIPESASGNATAFIRSGTFAGPYTAAVGNDVVTCDQWTTVNTNIDCDTNATGADLFVQDDLEVEGTVFVHENIEDGDADGVVGIDGDAGDEIATFNDVASAVNELSFTNAATGSGPSVGATGGDTNIDLNLVPKGTGIAAVVQDVDTPGAAQESLRLQVNDQGVELTSSEGPFLSFHVPVDAGSDEGARITAFRGSATDTDERASLLFSTSNGTSLVGAFTVGTSQELRASRSSAGWYLWPIASSDTQPAFVPDGGDTNTGIGQAASDQLSMIAGGVEAMRATETAGAIVITFHTDATAPATCSIGDMYVDTSGAYCACTATNTWSNMTATGACT